MICVSIPSLFSTKISGSVDQSDSSSGIVQPEKIEEKDLVPYSQFADSYKRPIIVFCKNNKAYIVNLGNFYLKIYQDLANNTYKEKYYSSDAEYKLKFHAGASVNGIWNIYFRPLDTKGLSPDIKDGEKLSFSNQVLEKYLFNNMDDGELFKISKNHHFLYFVVYPDGFDAYNSIRRFVLEKKINFDIKIFPSPETDDDSYVFFTKGVFLSDWQNYTVQE